VKRALAILAGGLLCLWLWIPPAGAHALLASSDPAAGATVASSPPQVTLTFTEPPDPKLSTVHVLNESGAPVDPTGAHAVPGHSLELRVPLGSLPDGTYTVSWRALSKTDGHISAGAFAFGVGTAPKAPVVPGSSQPTTPPPSPLSVVGKWMLYLGLAMLIGAASVALLVSREVPSLRWFRTGLVAAWLVAAVGLALAVVAEARAIDVPFRLFAGSSVGHELMAQAVSVLVVGAVVAVAAARRSSGWVVVLGVTVAAALFVHVLGGHANAPERGRWFNLAMQWAHVVAVGVWIGGLAWLFVLLPAAPAEQRGRVATRFSNMATVALAVVAVSGIVRALDLVGGFRAWRALWDTSFGITLLVKIGLFLVLVALGARNRFVNVPRLADGRSSERPLRRVVGAELLVAAGIFGVTAVLTGLPPARSALRSAVPAAARSVVVSGNDFATTTRARLVVTPGTVGSNRFVARVTDYDTGAPVPADRVSLQFDVPNEPTIGSSQLELTKQGDGTWEATGTNLSLDAPWRVTVLVQQATGAVEVPLVVAPRPPPQNVQVQAAPGQPTLYIVTFPDGTQVQMYLDPGKPGPNQVHATYFDAKGDELPIASATFQGWLPNGQTAALTPMRFSAGHFVGQGRLGTGQWHFVIVATTRSGTTLSSYFDQRIVG
jgi:copper transport protein